MKYKQKENSNELFNIQLEKVEGPKSRFLKPQKQKLWILKLKNIVIAKLIIKIR